MLTCAWDQSLKQVLIVEYCARPWALFIASVFRCDNTKQSKQFSGPKHAEPVALLNAVCALQDQRCNKGWKVNNTDYLSLINLLTTPLLMPLPRHFVTTVPVRLASPHHVSDFKTPIGRYPKTGSKSTQTYLTYWLWQHPGLNKAYTVWLIPYWQYHQL